MNLVRFKSAPPLTAPGTPEKPEIWSAVYLAEAALAALSGRNWVAAIRNANAHLYLFMIDQVTFE